MSFRIEETPYNNISDAIKDLKSNDGEKKRIGIIQGKKFVRLTLNEILDHVEGDIGV